MTNQPKQKTPLTEFIDDLLSGKITEVLSNKDKYLEKERQTIIDAFNQGYREGENVSELMDMHDGDVSQFEDAEIYFNNKYESHEYNL